MSHDENALASQPLGNSLQLVHSQQTTSMPTTGASSATSFSAVAMAAAAFHPGSAGRKGDVLGQEHEEDLTPEERIQRRLDERQRMAMTRHLDELERRKAREAMPTQGAPRKWIMVHLVTPDGSVQRRVQLHELVSGEFLLKGFAEKLKLIEWEHFQLAKVIGGGNAFARYLDAVEARLVMPDAVDEASTSPTPRARKFAPDASSQGGDHATAIPQLKLQWIHDEVKVMEQGVKEGDVLVLMVKLYTADVAECTCVRAVQLYYVDIAIKIFSHVWKVTAEQAYKLASFMVHIRLGSYSKAREKDRSALANSLGHILPASFIPRSKKARKAVTRTIFRYYKEYAGMRRTLAMINFCEYATLAAGYGSIVFHVHQSSSAAAAVGSAAPSSADSGDELSDGDGAMGALVDARRRASAPVRSLAILPQGLAVYDAAAWDAASADTLPLPLEVHTFESDIDAFTYDAGTLDVVLSSGRILSFEAAKVGADNDSLDGHDFAELSVEPMAHAREVLGGYQHFFFIGKVSTPGASHRRRTAFSVAVSLPSGELRESIAVTQTTTGDKVFREYADRLQITHRAGFGLCESTLDNDRWLDMNRPLVDQFVTKRTKLVFKMRYFFITDASIAAEDDDHAVMAIFHQVRQLILDGYYLVTEEEAIEFAAFSCFVENGAYDRSAHAVSMIVADGLGTYIPTWLRPKRKDREWATMVFSRFRKMGDVGSDVEAQKAYIIRAMDLTTFGITYFKVLSDDDRDLLLGVAPAGIVVFTATHFKKLHVFSYRDLRIDVTPAAVTLTVLVKDGEVDPLLGAAPSHWEDHIMYTETPLEAKSIREMASTYHRIAYVRAQVRARERARALAVSGAF
ncbi:uncharacterized protein AMSG_09494 [Thecamonas trahens ATCC 50062]|uniref:FERM domain-containing protein n=1 Tax=Thecamonas trahens ATCC 50062 TaxID=461836 RepID=A0A0L0DP26_THETB|nr:hypothetical protein AMSG_09494 [Thecamonas trahens ATCC 50062]KNC53776.1 hypothetical protein AMSG_09494 [Thecamonas trahens ATCC 50062]|eukprot:XP_013754338.1 hypothetical protein AMSG_09494 [Thecamonas trahens ATCC 50062]